MLGSVFRVGKLLLKPAPSQKRRLIAQKYFSSETKLNHTESKYGLSCTSYQSFQNIWCTRVGQREIFKTWIFSHFVISNAILLFQTRFGPPDDSYTDETDCCGFFWGKTKNYITLYLYMVLRVSTVCVSQTKNLSYIYISRKCSRVCIS
jgi:hypothetical protein